MPSDLVLMGVAFVAGMLATMRDPPLAAAALGFALVLAFLTIAGLWP